MEEQQNRMQVVLDYLGRAMDQQTGKYLRIVPSTEPPGYRTVKLGGQEGGFLTLDSEGDLVPWQKPEDYAAN